MARTVGDFVFERLSSWGVRRIFGYPGDGINAIIEMKVESRPPVTTTGPQCRWCPLAPACIDGQGYLRALDNLDGHQEGDGID